jgi:hypothetical protein
MKPQFIIFVETVTGDIIRAFTWCRDAASGIDRAWRDAADFEVIPARIWAEPVEITS